MSDIEQGPKAPEVLSSMEVLAKVKQYISEDNFDFLTDSVENREDPLGIDDLIGSVYGAILEAGYDPDEILSNLGILE